MKNIYDTIKDSFNSKDYDTFFGCIYPITRSIISSILDKRINEDVEDITQDVMLIIWENFLDNEICFPDYFLNYLKTTCKYVVHNYVTKFYRRCKIINDNRRELLDKYVYYINDHSDNYSNISYRKRESKICPIYIYSKYPFELVKIVNTVKEASDYTTADVSNIRKILKGKSANKSSKGFYFSYHTLTNKPSKRMKEKSNITIEEQY